MTTQHAAHSTSVNLKGSVALANSTQPSNTGSATPLELNNVILTNPSLKGVCVAQEKESNYTSIILNVKPHILLNQVKRLHSFNITSNIHCFFIGVITTSLIFFIFNPEIILNTIAIIASFILDT